MRSWKRIMVLLTFLLMLVIPISARADVGFGRYDDCPENIISVEAGTITHGKHTWVVGRSTNATCTSNGAIEYQCSLCGASYSESIPATGHSWGGWNVTTQPTCVEPGVQTRTCSSCGATETQSVPATGNHSWGSWTVTAQPTCAAAGSQSHTCAVCGTSESQSIPATGNHSYGSWTQTKAATCTAGGEEAHTCSVCGHTESRATSALGHSWGGWQITKAATCTSRGTEKRTCSRCGESESREIAMTAHTWGAWRTTRAATCDKTGEEERSCSVCGKKETREIQKIPHTYGEWTVEKEPTCTETGKRTHICRVCNHEETEEIAMIPHEFGEWTVEKEPTCTETGTRVHTCSVCGFEETEETDMIPHDFGEWVIVSALTDFSKGIRERTCKVCGYLEHEERDPAGTLRSGDRGEGVKQLQQALNDAGYDAGTVDGAFGPKTENALKDAEATMNKEEDGVGWPGVLKILLHGEEFPEDLSLSVQLTSEPAWYGEGQTATFDAVLTNTSGKDLTDFTIYQRSENADGTSAWNGIFEYNGTLAAGESITISELSYTVSAQDASLGHVLVSFYASGAADKTLYSNQEDLGIVTEAPGPEIELTADQVIVIPFAEGAEFTVPFTLVNHSLEPVSFDGLTAFGDSGAFSTESWMSQPLEPGQAYQFTYTDKLRPWEVSGDWTYRGLQAIARDPETGKFGYGFAHAFVVHQYNGPSVMLFADDTTGMGGDIGDEVYLPLYAVNNGTVDLKVSEIVDFNEEDYAIYDHVYDSYFAAGDSFPVEFVVKIQPEDALHASWNESNFWRNISLWADPLDGTDVEIDNEIIYLWFSGPLPGLTLTMTQTTPDQETWSPDESGQIGTIAYDCTVKNTGERSVLFKGLYVYLYPSTEAGELVAEFEDIVLEPNEAYSFTVTLPIGTANIYPGTASEAIDGVIQAEFTAIGMDPETLRQIAWTNPYDNTFTYKVKLNAYAWAPPASDGNGETEAAETEKPDQEEALDASLLVTKRVTSRAQLQTKPTESGDFYAEGERVTYEIYLYNFGSETLNDIEVIDRIGAAQTVLTKIPSLAPGEEHIAEFEYYVNLADAEDYQITNHAWATYRVGNSEEQVRSYEDTAVINVVNMTVGEGELSGDLELKKSHTGSPSASNGFYAERDIVHYSVQVTNTSDHSMENITVTDPLSGPGSIGTIAVLMPGESAVVGFDYEVTAKDVETGKIKNVARAEWTGDNGPQFANSNVNYVSTEAPALDIVKAVTNSPQQAGGFAKDEVIHYEITVTNTSQSDMGSLEVTDYKKPGDPIVGVIAGLAPGESATVGFDYTVTQADVDAGEVVNQAGVELHRNNYSGGSDQYVRSNELHTPTLHGEANVTVTKSEETSSPDPAGYALYETSQGLITVFNDSDQPLTDVVIYDMANGDAAGVYMGTIAQIDPGTFQSVAWGLTVTQEDVTRGFMTNAARAEFTDPYTGEARTEYAPEITIPVKQPDTVYGGLSVVKSAPGEPDKGGFYVEGEEITFHVDVTNNSGETVKEVTVYEPMVDGGILYTAEELADGESLTGLIFTYQVTALDVENGEVINVATVHATGESGNKYIALSNPAIVPTGKRIGETENPEETVQSTETEQPKESGKPEDPEKPEAPEVPGEPQQPTEPTAPGEPQQPAEPTAPGEPQQTEEPEAPGENQTPGTPGTPSGAADPGMVSTPAGTANTGAVYAPDAGGASGETGAAGERFCIRVLTGKGEGTREYELRYCEEHAAVADSVRDLLEQAKTEEDQLTAWRQSIALWTEALHAEYDEWMEEKTEPEKARILEERTLFFVQLACAQDSLAARYPGEPLKAAMYVSEQLMNKTADVCYERHAAPDARLDSAITGRYVGLADAEPAENCLRDVTQTGTGASYLENLCEKHRITEAAIDALLQTAADETAQADVWKSAGQLWLVELDAIINERYLAADDEMRLVIAAERVSYGNWLKAREAALSLLYPDRPEIVNEVIAQTIRAQVLDLCTEYD